MNSVFRTVRGLGSRLVAAALACAACGSARSRNDAGGDRSTAVTDGPPGADIAPDESYDAGAVAPDAAPDGGSTDGRSADDRQPDVGQLPPNLSGICTESGWCWQRPRPQGNDLAAIWVAAEDDVWAVGYGGTIIHWDGQAWSSRAIPGAHDDLYTVWGTGTQVWVGGAGTTRHWMANAWKQDLGAASGARAIFGTGAADGTANTFGNHASISATPDRGAFYAGWGLGVLHHDP